MHKMLSAYFFLFLSYSDQQYSGQYYITVGNHNRREDEEFERTYSVKREIIHPDYDPYNFDIALLELDDEIDYNIHVHPVCLPQQNEVVNGDCAVVGWGHTDGKYL